LPNPIAPVPPTKLIPEWQAKDPAQPASASLPHLNLSFCNISLIISFNKGTSFFL